MNRNFDGEKKRARLSEEEEKNIKFLRKMIALSQKELSRNQKK